MVKRLMLLNHSKGLGKRAAWFWICLTWMGDSRRMSSEFVGSRGGRRWEAEKKSMGVGATVFDEASLKRAKLENSWGGRAVLKSHKCILPITA